MKDEIEITEAEVLADRGGVLVYRTLCGRIIQGTDFDGRGGCDLIGETLDLTKLFSLKDEGEA